MMGQRQQAEPKLFYTGVNLAGRVPDDHFLRRLNSALDFEFVRPAVSQFYGANGNESIDPIVLVKLMLLLFLEDCSSERQLVRQLAYRIDWLWFCGLDLDDEIPNHSVLSKARRRWGPEIFESLFCRVLEQCIASGLVDGRTIHVDSSCIDGNVDREKLQPVLRVACLRLGERLDEPVYPATKEDKASATPEPRHPSGRLTGVSDREAGVTKSYGRTVCGYKDHRAVDDARGIITATVTTDAAVNEGHVLKDVMDAHEANTGEGPDLVAADKQYGTGENYGHLRQRKVTPCIPHKKSRSPRGKFGRKQFAYDPQNDCFTCPAGETLRPYHRNYNERRIRYRAARGVCAACSLRVRCTAGKHGRRVERHMDQDHIDWADGCLNSHQRRHYMKRRKSVIEGSFADAANNHGFKRARWRGLVRMTIQNLLVATCQNLRKLLKSRLGRRYSAAGVLGEALLVVPSAVLSVWFCLRRQLRRVRQHYDCSGAGQDRNCLLQPC